MSGGNRVADRLGVPYCGRRDRPIWIPALVLFVAWLGRRYHYFCYRRDASERPAG